MTIPLGSPLVSPAATEIIRPTPMPGVGAAEGAGEGPSFEGRLVEMMDSVSALDHRATEAADGYLAGAHDDVHGTMIAMQEADVALRFATNVRNRVVEAYREVMRMGG